MDERNMPQPMRPRGFVGHIFGMIMERLSAPNYRWVIRQLKAIKPQSYLEIGFGTGRLAELVATQLKPKRLAGVDPAELMLKTARKRLRRFARKTSIELHHGDDSLLASLTGPFDAIVATHSFQFWSDPVATLARVHALLAPQGLLVLVLRTHFSGSVTPWIPNPISKSGDELGSTRRALADSGFRIIADEKLKTGSHGIVAKLKS
jgi:ubiquinone/menaquinone biosynthesis C-methylase UbiE